MTLLYENYREQRARWPTTGRHILAQFDDTSVVVYQAYRPAIGRFAAENGFFGDEFSLSRMSWIKPNFLWMMYRCGWATKPGQEVVLAVRLQRSAFDLILSEAVHSAFVPGLYGTREDWQTAVKQSSVRLQWDPDHAPCGAKVERRALQLGLRGPVLAKYARQWVLEIEDITGFVAEQRRLLDQQEELTIPSEWVYTPSDEGVRRRLEIADQEQGLHTCPSLE